MPRNLVEQTDSFRRYQVVNEAGEVVGEDIESTNLPTGAANTADVKLDIVKAKLTELEALTAPVLAADVVDILTEIKEAI